MLVKLKLNNKLDNLQILLGASETIVKINSKSISIDYIQHFISTHFGNRKIEDNSIVIPASYQNEYHRTFLLKWLYSLYVKKNKDLPELKESLLRRHHKAIKIITTKRIVHVLSYKIIDNENIQVKITPSNNNIAYKLKTFLQTTMIIMPAYLQITFHSDEEKERLKDFISTHEYINVPHQHRYNHVKMKEFLASNEEEVLTPMQNACLVLGISEGDDLKTVKKRYKSLAKEFHPDTVHKENIDLISTYTKKFQTIVCAYEIVLQQEVV